MLTRNKLGVSSKLGSGGRWLIKQCINGTKLAAEGIVVSRHSLHTIQYSVH